MCDETALRPFASGLSCGGCIGCYPRRAGGVLSDAQGDRENIMAEIAAEELL